MKNTIKARIMPTLRLTAIALVIVFNAVLPLTGCDNGTTPGVIFPIIPQATTVTIAAIQGVTVPVTGRIPVTSITENAQYSGTVTWSPNHSTFAVNTQYTATITLTAKTDNTLQGVAANFFTVTGAASVSNNANSGIITAIFPATGAVITIAAIQGVAPITGRTPVTAITSSAQYTGTVTWSPSHSIFAASTQYTATITLTPKPGYTLQGVTANFFTVAGATSVSNAANSGVITAVFSQASEVLTVTNTTEWNNALNRIATSGNGTYSTPKTYTIMVSGDITVPAATQTFGSVSYVAVTLQGNGKLSLNSQGNMIQVGNNQTLIIDSANLTLQGMANNNTSLIYCSGKLEMRNGTIQGNTNVSQYIDTYGGGVYVNGNFTMSGGTISGSSRSSTSYMMNSTDTLNSLGGGVYVNGNFTMDGGTINGSCYSSSTGTSTIDYSSHVNSYGGGVFVGGTFIMNGGTISGSSNSSSQKSITSSYGGGVYANSFTMTGGTISGSSSSSSNSYGGGVCVITAFTKTGGIIYGNDATDTNKNNVAGNGHAVYYASGTGYYRNNTLGENDSLYSASPLPANSGQTLNGWTKR